jgi:hypothetical protein
VAVTKLQLYNDALRIIGERKLASETEARESRYRLDDIYDFGAIDYCLEITKPRFASLVDKISTSVTSTEYGFANTFDLPADYLAMVGLFSDAGLDEPITRFIEQGRTIATDHAAVYLRYTSTTSGAVLASWPPSFTRLVSAYLAKELAPRIRPDAIESASANFASERGVFLTTDSAEETRPRSKPATATLTPEWLSIYNDALFILGQEQLISVNDDSQRRSVLDAALSQSTVEFHLEDTAWKFALASGKIDYNPSVEPSWGYRRAFDKPADLLSIDGVFYDEYMRSPLKDYSDEGGYFFADVDSLYFQYISNNTLSQPSTWPAYFRKVISAELAFASAGVLGGDAVKAAIVLEARVSSAKSNDAMQSPPRILAPGNWARSRNQGSSGRGRP